MEDVVIYNCPSCAAPLAFDIGSQRWECKFCGSDYTKDQIEKEAKDSENEFKRKEPRPEETLDGDISAWECPSCGGRIITDATTAATFCVYCHNPAVITARLKDERKPDYIIPFKLGKDEAVEAVRKLCKLKPLLPKAFKDSVQNGEVSGLYVPYWLFSGELHAGITGKGKRINTWSDSRYRYTKTDTYAVVREADISLRHVPADGSSRLDDRLMESLEPYEYKELQEFSMAYISGHYAETYDVDASQARSRAEPRIRDGAAGLMRRQVSGYTVFDTDNVSVEPRYLDHEYAMLPVWTLMHDFGGKKYYFAMNGQTGKVSGKLPMSPLRLLAVAGAAWLLSFGVFMLAILIGV